jgi:beta-lactamase regulating signal transducer with metallopeptidase domain/DUF4097 and DUF4098 domain-containing protein YvlB
MTMLIVKLTLVLITGAGAAFLLRRQAAALRHYLWLLTLAGTLAVAIPATLPWRIDVPLAVGAPSSPVSAIRNAFDSTPKATPSAEASAVPRPSALDDPARSRPAFPRPSLATLWLLGAALVLGWHLLGHWGIARLSRGAAPVRDPGWLRLLERVRIQLGVRVPVAVRQSATVGSPLVCGLVRPTLLLPVEADGWNEQRRRVVVLHELAHVARRDALTQLVASLACAVWWFHPGVWLAARRLRAESERACDDRVMAAGISAPDYASHLLGVARNARALRLTGAIALTMARRSTLEGRLLAMLDARRRGGVVTNSARTVGAAALVALLTTLALVQPVAPVARAASGKSHEGSKPESPFRDAVDAKPGGTLVLELETGGTVTVQGWSQNQVQVDGVLAGKDWEQTQTDLSREGDRIVFTSAPKDNEDPSFSTSHRFEIHVPRRFDVKIRSAGGRITLIDLEGSMTGYSGGGGITMKRLKGHANLTTGGGAIDVDDVDMTGKVSTGGGQVRLSRVRGGLRGTSGSGPVVQVESDGSEDGSGDLDDVEIDASDIKVGNSTTGRLRINKAGGDIRVDQAPEGVAATTGGGQVTIGPSGKDVAVSTGGGSIMIGPATGSVSATTGAGDVRVVVAKGGGAEREFTLSSGKGAITIELTRGVGVDLDLETAYTDGFGRKTSIRSDVPVDIHATSNWDDSHGTPRKYLRARAKSGDGKVRVNVRTVNGDIVLKYR